MNRITPTYYLTEAHLTLQTLRDDAHYMDSHHIIYWSWKQYSWLILSVLYRKVYLSKIKVLSKFTSTAIWVLSNKTANLLLPRIKMLGPESLINTCYPAFRVFSSESECCLRRLRVWLHWRQCPGIIIKKVKIGMSTVRVWSVESLQDFEEFSRGIHQNMAKYWPTDISSVSVLAW